MQKHENSNSNTQFPSPISIPTPRKKPSAHQNRRDKSSSSNPSKIVFWTERKTKYRGSSDPGAASRKFQSETEIKREKTRALKTKDRSQTRQKRMRRERKSGSEVRDRKGKKCRKELDQWRRGINKITDMQKKRTGSEYNETREKDQKVKRLRTNWKKNKESKNTVKSGGG